MCLAPSPTILSTDEVGSVAPPIFTSVGQDAVNGPGDVFVIQSLLNKRLPQPHTEVPVTGVMDPGTILAIKAFQAVMMNMNPPSGYVAPGSPTYYALAARPLVDQEAAAADEVWPCRHRSPRRDRGGQGLAEALGHSGLDHPGAMDRRERLGIGDAARQQQPVRHQGAGVAARRGKRDARSDRRQGDHDEWPASDVSTACPKPSNCMASCCRRDRPIGRPWRFVQDPDQFADALTGVYATDPQYGTTLKWVMDNYQLKQYDTKA